MLSGHIREPGHSKFINRPLHNRLRRPLFHLWEHNGQAPSPRLLLWYTAPQEPHTGAYYLWIYHGLLDDSSTTALFLQMQLMLPLVIRADSGFYGSEDWSTRLDCVFWGQGHVWLPCSGGGWWLREQWEASFFCLWCRQSRGELIFLWLCFVMFNYQLLH